MDKIYFEKLGIILESIVKLINIQDQRILDVYNDLLEQNADSIKLTRELLKLFSNIVLENSDKLGLDSNKIIKHLKEMNKGLDELIEKNTNREAFYQSEYKKFTEEKDDVIQDIKDFLKKLHSDKKK